MAFRRRARQQPPSPDQPLPPALAAEVDGAMALLKLQTEAHEGAWRISQADWQIDQGSGTIVFTTPAGLRVESAVQIIGTHDSTDGTWLWAWENPSIDAGLRAAADRVREYGAEHGYADLTMGEVACSEYRAWEFTALADLITEAQGAYSGPVGTARVFVTFGEARITKA